MPQEGLEPPHPCEYQILSLARLPVPPLGLRMCQAQRTGLPAKSADRFRRLPTSFHEVGTVAKTDCKAKAVAYRRARFPNAQGHGGDEAGVGVSCARAAHFAHSRTRTLGGLPGLSHSTPVEEKGSGRSGQSRQRQGAASRVDRTGADIASKPRPCLMGRSACNTSLRAMVALTRSVPWARASEARVGRRSCGALWPPALLRPGASCRQCCCW